LWLSSACMCPTLFGGVGTGCSSLFFTLFTGVWAVTEPHRLTVQMLCVFALIELHMPKCASSGRSTPYSTLPWVGWGCWWVEGQVMENPAMYLHLWFGFFVASFLLTSATFLQRVLCPAVLVWSSRSCHCCAAVLARAYYSTFLFSVVYDHTAAGFLCFGTSSLALLPCSMPLTVDSWRASLFRYRVQLLLVACCLGRFFRRAAAVDTPPGHESEGSC
jgi:hypothetical protein